MQLKLNKADLMITIVFVIISLVAIVFVNTKHTNSTSKVANVYYQNKLVHTFDLSKKEASNYEIQASNGLVVIESKDGKVRVVNETSARHICSIQGWSDSEISPIVCLPNELYVKIEGSQEENDVDGVIK